MDDPGTTAAPPATKSQKWSLPPRPSSSPSALPPAKKKKPDTPTQIAAPVTAPSATPAAATTTIQQTITQTMTLSRTSHTSPKKKTKDLVRITFPTGAALLQLLSVICSHWPELNWQFESGHVTITGMALSIALILVVIEKKLDPHYDCRKPLVCGVNHKVLKTLVEGANKDAPVSLSISEDDPDHMIVEGLFLKDEYRCSLVLISIDDERLDMPEWKHHFDALISSKVLAKSLNAVANSGADVVTIKGNPGYVIFESSTSCSDIASRVHVTISGIDEGAWKDEDLRDSVLIKSKGGITASVSMKYMLTYVSTLRDDTSLILSIHAPDNPGDEYAAKPLRISHIWLDHIKVDFYLALKMNEEELQ